MSALPNVMLTPKVKAPVPCQLNKLGIITSHFPAEAFPSDLTQPFPPAQKHKHIAVVFFMLAKVKNFCSNLIYIKFLKNISASSLNGIFNSCKHSQVFLVLIGC